MSRRSGTCRTSSPNSTPRMPGRVGSRVSRCRHGRWVAAITFDAADLPEDVVALVDAHLLDLGGTYGVPEAGDPIQYAELRLEHAQGAAATVHSNPAVRRYDRSGSDCLSGTISEGDSSSRLASINARRIFSITVISVFIAVRLSRVPAHCSSLLESPFERTARCRAVFRMASEASFRWTASSVKVSRSMIMVSGPLTGPVSETGAMIRRVPPGAGTPPLLPRGRAGCRGPTP